MRYLMIILFLISANNCAINREIKYCQENEMGVKYVKKELLNSILRDLEEMNSNCDKFKKITSVKCIRDSLDKSIEKEFDGSDVDLMVKVKKKCEGTSYIYYFNGDFKIVKKITEMSPVHIGNVEII